MIYTSSLSFPNMFSTSSGKTRLDTSFDAINNRLSLLLQTAYLELLGNPDFGCGLYETTFDYAIEYTYNNIKDMVVDAIRKYEPSLIVSKDTIDVYSEIGSNVIKITISYQISGSDIYNSTSLTLGVNNNE